MAEQIDRLLTQQEVVEWTKMSPAYFEQARHRGDTTLIYVRIGRSIRYRVSDVQRWITDHMVGSGI